jgi:drug/metabolite transporter (DMT)-like permease
VFKTIVYTTFALVAFACNSILCRLALRSEEADAASFTSLRLISGAVALILIGYFFSKKSQTRSGSWPSAFFLFAYAACFSFAYINLTAGTGALILFGSVQMTMIAVALARGEKPKMLEWLGLITAVGGLVYLVLPGLASPPPVSSGLMAAAGVAWGAYTLRGRASGDPLGDTAGNFIRAAPMGIIISVIFIPAFHLSNRGIILAILSGAVTSGIGYTVWYAALKHHTATRAAVLQLLVPVLTAVIGVLFLAETADRRLVIAAGLILGGIGLTIVGRNR